MENALRAVLQRSGKPWGQPSRALLPPQRRVAILGVCAWGGGAEVEPRGLRLSRVPPVPPGPPAPPVPHCVVCAEATERLCGSHTEAALGQFRSTLGAGAARPHFFKKTQNP